MTVTGIRRPIAERPGMPKGYGVPETPEGLLKWDWAEEILAEGTQYWLATVRPDGRPHAIPIWGAYHDGLIYVEGGATTRWARNLAARPDITVHVERGKEVLMVEGVAERAREVGEEAQRGVKEQYRAKYPEYTPELIGWNDGALVAVAGGFWVVRPAVAFGWAEFPGTCTRWRFT